MSQHDFEITNADANTGITMRAAINAALQALVSLSSGAAEPTTTYAYQLWADTTSGFVRQRNAANSAWINLFPLGIADIGLGYDVIWIPANAMSPLYTNGAAPASTEYPTNDIQCDYLAFDPATEEFAAFNIAMPEAWDLGTVKVKFYWIPVTSAGAPGDTVEWKIAANAISNDDEVDTAMGTAQVISDAVLTGEAADLHITAATPALTIGGTPALGDMVHFKVSRNVSGTDTFAYDALLFGILIQIKKGVTVVAW